MESDDIFFTSPTQMQGCYDLVALMFPPLEYLACNVCASIKLLDSNETFFGGSTHTEP